MKLNVMDNHLDQHYTSDIRVKIIYFICISITGIGGWLMDNFDFLNALSTLVLKWMSIILTLIAILLKWPELKDHFIRKIKNYKKKKP